jgi:ubiquinol-cytochrome c reductase cytochrome b subunit
MRALLRWIDEQTGLITSIKEFMEEPLAKGVGWPHVFGSAALFLFIVQAVTGIMLMVYYVPAPADAYSTVQYINSQVPFGRIVRGLHHWGASAMLVMVGLHMLQTFFWGAYKRPRQIIWVIGVFLLLCTFVLGFTGYLLPWDQKAYWATVVGTNFANAIPKIGGFLRDLLRGGEGVGAITLTRFFALHVFIMPAVLAALITFHVLQVRRQGITPPWRRVGEEADVPRPQLFYPDQVFKDVVVALVVVAVLIYAAWRLGAPIEPVANPADTAYIPRPEWYFLWMFQLLKYAPPTFEFWVAIVLPAVAVALLLVYPYLDRNPERRPLRRPYAVALAVLTFGGVSYLGVLGVVTTPKEERLTPAEQRGQKTFLDLRCNACHGISGRGGTVGPDLAETAPHDPKLTRQILLDPTSINPRSIMPAVKLPPDKLDDLVAYIAGLTSRSVMPAQPAVGPQKPLSHLEQNWFINHKFEVRKDPRECQTCHKPSFCQSCHANRRPDSHLHQWMKFHFGTAREQPEYCQVCHAPQFCDSCHKTFLHTPKWLTEHGPAGYENPAMCARCHDAPAFCNQCHSGARPASHAAPDWLHRHARADRKSCGQCHTPAFCTTCHTGARPKSHAAPDWVTAAHGKVALSKTSRCQDCHTQDFCQNCHGTAMPHPKDWALTHGSAASFDPAAFCFRCHDRAKFCGQCHEVPPVKAPGAAPAPGKS